MGGRGEGGGGSLISGETMGEFVFVKVVLGTEVVYDNTYVHVHMYTK